MGLFDEVRFKYPLPLAGANDRVYQTKDLDCVYMEQYEVREDGSLWREAYDIEDHSDPNAEGIFRFSGSQTRVNKHWMPMSWTGEMHCYDFALPHQQGWIEWKVTFVDGKVYRCELVEHRLGERQPTKENDMKTRTIPAGTLVHIHGIPVELTQDVLAETSAGNWEVIDQFIVESAQAADAVARPASSEHEPSTRVKEI